MPTVISRVNANLDDGHHRSTVHTYNTDTAELQIGHFSPTTERLSSWHRFTNIQVPQGALILDAFITYEAFSTNSNTQVNGQIDAEASDNTSTPTHAEHDGGSVQGENHSRQRGNRTVAIVPWLNVEAVVAGNFYNTPNISAIIQEIVARLGWLQGNAMTIYVGDEDDESDNNADTRRLWSGHDTDAVNAPLLTVTYSVTEVAPAVHGTNIARSPDRMVLS